MKTIKHFALALVAVACGLSFTSCDQNNPDDYSNYPQLIVGKWFNFTPETSIFIQYDANGNIITLGYDKEVGNEGVFKDGWMYGSAKYRCESNNIIITATNPDGSQNEVVNTIEVTQDQLIIKDPKLGDRIHYRVQESFDIKGNYSYLKSVVRVVAAEGKTALQLPEGVTFLGQNAIPVEAMHGDRIIDVMKKFFADATFAADGVLNHTMDGVAKTKNYTLDGNNLTFNLYEGSETYKVNATSFPDEDGDRLFIIIPKQAAWLGGMVDLVEKEQAGLKLTEAQIAELEKEFLATFETFTVVLSLSKK